LNPHMSALLQDKAKTLDLAGKPCACIGLGDHRYFYTARAADYLQHYVAAHHGGLMLPVLKIIDEPYGQEKAVRIWGKQLVEASKMADGC
jgi:flavodoxin I